MACPMGYGVRFQGGAEVFEAEENDATQEGTNKAKSGKGVSYHDYLQASFLDKLLSAQTLRSEVVGKQSVPDEHLFIITHQTYELWFKQVIFDIDHVRNLLNNKIVDETKMLQIVSLLERTVRILNLLADQMLILESMSPLDFVEFRDYLTSASGFQSVQFRLLENKLGVVQTNRVKYNAQHYLNVFQNKAEMQRLVDSETEPSLFVLIDRWLARTPGIYDDELADVEESKDDSVESNGINEATREMNAMKLNGDVKTNEKDSDSDAQSLGERSQMRKNFWGCYVSAVNHYLTDMKAQIDLQQDEEERAQAEAEFRKTKLSFNTIIGEEDYNVFLRKNERRLSYHAFKGALMIYFYRDMPRFSQPYQILKFLMDIDSLLQKWRYNHVMLVQRMLGSKQGTGGSSGYMYLRSTVSDRYKIFLDLFNLSTWLLPRTYIPKLTPTMVKTLSEHSSFRSTLYG
ncbi:Tryptophan 2,3-dioxygenase [Aphelenchoides bicaudatus]|nr:Tryptophan 2,3-dioxygenase [Aphelenchoides bicaudatus]